MTSDQFDDYISAVYEIEEDDVYGELAERDMLRKDSVQFVATTRRRDASDCPRRSRLAIRCTSKRQSSERDASDRSDDSDDDVQQLREKLEQAEAEAEKSRKKSIGRREDREVRGELLTRRRRKAKDSPSSSERTESD
jgi:hypothetical protein